MAGGTPRPRAGSSSAAAGLGVAAGVAGGAESVDFPTTDDIARLAQLVINVERKVDARSRTRPTRSPGAWRRSRPALDSLASAKRRRPAGAPSPPPTGSAVAASTNGEGAGAGAADPLRLQALVRGLGILAGDVRVATGTTPKDVVWTRGKTVLCCFPGRRLRAHATPVLLIYALINKPYILDLRQGSNFVGHLLREAYDIALLDWGTPGLGGPGHHARRAGGRAPAEGRGAHAAGGGRRRLHPLRLLHGRHLRRHARRYDPRA